MSLLLVIGVEFFPPSRFLVSDNVFFSLWLILADNFAFAYIEDLPTSILGHFRRFNPCRDQLCCGNHKSQKRSKTDNCFLEGGGGRAPSRCITVYNESRCMQRRLGASTPHYNTAAAAAASAGAVPATPAGNGDGAAAVQ